MLDNKKFLIILKFLNDEVFMIKYFSVFLTLWCQLAFCATPNYQDEDFDLQSQEGITRHSDWDYQQGWRNNRDAYLNGETQDQAYRKSHPNGRGGIGYDSDYSQRNSYRS